MLGAASGVAGRRKLARDFNPNLKVGSHWRTAPAACSPFPVHFHFYAGLSPWAACLSFLSLLERCAVPSLLARLIRCSSRPRCCLLFAAAVPLTPSSAFTVNASPSTASLYPPPSSIPGVALMQVPAHPHFRPL
ncbi:hypothetical protein IQ07DRAFT_376054 [Pyrenochaeta sp. DS3sAY3a]|nr:hypothetical protein IQ07DRAFT_376054 [Pyrenochaeta sp. DS3sAY3a]